MPLCVCHESWSRTRTLSLQVRAAADAGAAGHRVRQHRRRPVQLLHHHWLLLSVRLPRPRSTPDSGALRCGAEPHCCSIWICSFATNLDAIIHWVKQCLLGDCRTAVNNSCGARTPLASMISGIAVMVVLLCLTTVFKNMSNNAQARQQSCAMAACTRPAPYPYAQSLAQRWR